MTNQEIVQEHRAAGHAIEVADKNLVFRQVVVNDATPTGAQISHAAGFALAQQAVVLHFLPDGDLEDIRPNQNVNLNAGRQFIVVETDRLFFLTINGERFEWPSRMISGAVVRKLGKVPSEDEVLLTRVDEPDRVIEPRDLLDLGKGGIEAFVSRKPSWKLNVQGVILTLHQPTIVVKQALLDAGFDPTKGWQIFLIVKDEPKRAVGLDYTVNLRTPGIEKLRLTPTGVHNGEAAAKPRRHFDLLEVDEKHLVSLGVFWETVIDGTSRWLLIHNYQVPPGYTPRMVMLAFLIPPTYPTAQIDMFYTSPKLNLTSGQPIDRTQVAATIFGTSFNGWSRHRGPPAPWNPATDNVITHLALVESAIAKEVGQ
ncbi:MULTISPECIES: multiubiquitin domain-containing protein [unclassified Bradyrhizobium]|uniref:multiubiquitin domain-containing protein n=1 Tax=unclassified Bradyrhizobium TaxID=2631580 RepID=UPI001FF812B2|nr:MULTISPECIES: multiubiquitin domain-containing protein [unclassified Bradyrhizobium]MCK1298468.1 multiubiquitin domain-containing protein [Bradyrhizobium sp. 37]MCK1769512.1 multiubiquitin domain-containing protein [Bradyrhizobium sp. 134]